MCDFISPCQIPKLLHVVISMTVGGAEKLVYDMARHDSFAEKKPIICCLDELGALGEKLRGQGFKVYVKNRKSGIDWSIIFWLKKIMRNEDIEVVHAHQYTPLFYSVIAAYLAGRLNVVYTEHGRFYPDRKSWKRALVNPFLAKGVNHLVSISNATAKAMATYDKLPLDRIKVLHNGIDCARMNPVYDQSAKRRELNLSDQCKVIGTAARLDSIKNISMMIRGLLLVLQQVPDTCLVIAGQGEEEGQLKALAKELNIVDRVRFVGLRFDLAEIYPLFDVFLLTSFSEGVSITLLEAMSSGVPAVVTNVGGNREVVQEGLTGYLVPVDNDNLFAERIGELLRDRPLCQKMGVAAQKRVNESFSLQGMVKRYHQLYEVSRKS